MMKLSNVKAVFGGNAELHLVQKPDNFMVLGFAAASKKKNVKVIHFRGDGKTHTFYEVGTNSNGFHEVKKEKKFDMNLACPQSSTPEAFRELLNRQQKNSAGWNVATDVVYIMISDSETLDHTLPFHLFLCKIFKGYRPFTKALKIRHASSLFFVTPPQADAFNFSGAQTSAMAILESAANDSVTLRFPTPAVAVHISERGPSKLFIEEVTETEVVVIEEPPNSGDEAKDDNLASDSVDRPNVRKILTKKLHVQTLEKVTSFEEARSFLCTLRTCVSEVGWVVGAGTHRALLDKALARNRVVLLAGGPVVVDDVGPVCVPVGTVAVG
jgi:hypothetical protein